MTKKCPGCAVIKPLEDFHRHTSTKDGRQTYCKLCVKTKDAVRWKNADGSYRESRRLALKRDYIKNAPRRKAALHLKKYGISVEERLSLLSAQNGKCASCGDTLTTRRRKDSRGVVDAVWVGELDHDHTTGRVRGLLCINCNTALGLLRDSADRIIQLLLYTERCRQD